jgi:hypothetical protein
MKKVTKANSIKMLLSFAFILLMLTSSCTQSGNNSGTEKNEAAKVAVEKPKMDIPTAVVSGNLEVVRQHIKAGSNINKKDQMTGSTPLITAVTFGKTEVAKALIDANADLSLKNNDGSTALHVAAFFCRIEIVQMLIDAKADRSILNNYGATPRQTVLGPFEEVKPVYEMLQKQLEPFGFEIDLNEVEKSRPVVAMMLQ